MVLIGGGIIPKKDKKLLEKRGTYGNFDPGMLLCFEIKIQYKFSANVMNPFLNLNMTYI